MVFGLILIRRTTFRFLFIKLSRNSNIITTGKFIFNTYSSIGWWWEQMSTNGETRLKTQPKKIENPLKMRITHTNGVTRFIPKYLTGCKNSGNISWMEAFLNSMEPESLYSVTHTRALPMNPLWSHWDEWCRVSTVFVLMSGKTEIAKSVKGPKSQGLFAEDVLVELYFGLKILVIWLQQITKLSVKDVNLDTIIDLQSWFKTWLPNGSSRIRAKKLLRKLKGACKSSWSQEPFTLTIPGNLAQPVKT